MQHRSIRGTIRYLSKKPESFNQLRGRESFHFTLHADGCRTLRAHCELEIPQPKLLRDILCAYDAQGHVLDAYVRLSLDDRFLGAGWYYRDGGRLHLEAWSPSAGRISQSVRTDASFEDLVTHPVAGDGYGVRLLDPSQGPHQRRVQLHIVSPDHRGATPPTIASVSVTIAYLGDEEVTVPAGTFKTHHYQYLGDGDNAHPPINVWVTADGDFVYVKGRIDGYFMSEYELIELSRD